MDLKPIKILLVEDNPDHIELTLRALRNNNVVNEIYVVKDGQQAIDFIYNKGEFSDKSKAPRPGVILLDVKLPKMDGFEVLRHLKKDPEFKSIPVVMLTTSAREEEIAKGYTEGANSYVTKPVNFKDFAQKINEIKLYWMITNTLPPPNNHYYA